MIATKQGRRFHPNNTVHRCTYERECCLELQLAQAQAENQRLRAALRPFAEARIRQFEGDSAHVVVDSKDIIRAAAALEEHHA
ncbi:MAG: hypothetical protein PHU85_18735 [Phycisphaerae bacterium]|nr:hypothetical protein [Phycisphaerae bacterium]